MIGIFDELDGDQYPGVLKPLARETGGVAFFPESSHEIASVCEEIAKDIPSVHAGLCPTNAKVRDGVYRIIDVKANSPTRGRLSVRTRTGYTVPTALTPPAPRSAGHDSQH